MHTVAWCGPDMSDWRTLFEEPTPQPTQRIEGRSEPQVLELEPLHPEPMMVPAEYAEKTMHSILRLHDELMDEKDKRMELVEKLSAREQALAEMAAYVALLEAQLESGGGRAAWKPASAPKAQARPKAPPPPRAPPPPPKWEGDADSVDAWVEWTMRDAEPEAEAEPEPRPRADAEPKPGFKSDPRKPEDWKVW